MAEQIATRYGIGHFRDIEAIRFTFHAQADGRSIERSWVWQPASDIVTLEAAAKTSPMPLPAPYHRGRHSWWPAHRAKQRQVDQWFINDQYWLLFPFHLVWDDHVTVLADGLRTLPIGPGAAEHVEVTYDEDTGYTPGDVYELFVDPNLLIQQWVYHKGGSAAPTRIATWERHVQAGPLTVSTEHHGPNGFHVWFTGVAVRMRHSKEWLAAPDPSATMKPAEPIAPAPVTPR